MYPYTRMNNGCLVYHDDVVAALPVPPDEIPVSFSEAYFLTEREDMAYTNEYGEHPVIRTAYKRSDGSIFIQSADNDQETLLMDLGETGLAIYRYGGPDDYSSTQSLYNNQYDLAFPPGVNTYLRPFSNGYWFTNRGIYTGIIDTDGSWMVRISAWEE